MKKNIFSVNNKPLNNRQRKSIYTPWLCPQLWRGELLLPARWRPLSCHARHLTVRRKQTNHCNSKIFPILGKFLQKSWAKRFLTQFSCFRKVTSLRDGHSEPPTDSLLRFLVESSSDEYPSCANCDRNEKSPMFFCNTCGKSSSLQSI